MANWISVLHYSRWTDTCREAREEGRKGWQEDYARRPTRRVRAMSCVRSAETTTVHDRDRRLTVRPA